MAEQQPLLQSADDLEGNSMPSHGTKSWRQWTAEKLETKTFQTIVIGLITVDSILVLADLSYSYLSNACGPDAVKTPLWLDILSHISIVITILFLVEMLAFIWAIGPSYYSPFRSLLHFCDGAIIVTTIVVEVLLKGRERELASILILFRLLRFAGEAAVGVGELNERTLRELTEARTELAEKTRLLAVAEGQIRELSRLHTA